MPKALALLQGNRNLSLTERGISALVGLGLAAAGTRPRPNPLLNVLALAGGSYLALRAATGYCPVKQALRSIAPPRLRPVPVKVRGGSRRFRAARI